MSGSEVTDITVTENDSRLPYFSEALKARGIEEQPWVLRAFAEKKDLGLNEADIVRSAEDATPVSYARAVRQRMLEGTALGVVTVPAVDWVKGGRPWREVVKRSPITVGVGALLGAAVGWVAGKVHNCRISSAVEGHFEEFKLRTHEMETAWTEALANQAAKKRSEENIPLR